QIGPPGRLSVRNHFSRPAADGLGIPNFSAGGASMSLSCRLVFLPSLWRRQPAQRRPGRRQPALRLRFEPLEDRAVPSVSFWSGFGGNAQHTAVSPVGSQSLDAIQWQSKVDLNPQYSGDDLLIHYGEPAVTQKNTIIIPVKTGAFDGFRIEAR